jgi:hypothetical protein
MTHILPRHNPAFASYRLCIARCLGLMVLIGCTDPTAIGPEPQFVSLQDFSIEARASQPENRIAQEFCPSVPAPASTAERVQVAGGVGLSIGLPNDAVIRRAPFADERGEVLSVEGRGMIVVSYGNRFPIVRPNRFGNGGSTEFEFFVYDAVLPATSLEWCVISLGGRPARLHLQRLPGEFDGRGAQYRDRAVITSEGPRGDLLNVSLLGSSSRIGPVFANLPAYELLRIASSLQW